VAFIIMGVLLCVLCVPFPLALWIFWRIGRAKVEVRPDGLTAEGPVLTDVVRFEDVQRLGLLRVPLVAKGLGATIANMKLDNLGEGLNLVFRLKDGSDVKFIANQYERHTELIEAVRQATRLPCEPIQMGLLSWKWPER
jgi:hypothetical protein